MEAYYQNARRYGINLSMGAPRGRGSRNFAACSVFQR
jgi:hypothetical protein